MHLFCSKCSGHAFKGDLKWLSSIGVDTRGVALKVIDTQSLEVARTGVASQQVSLEKLATAYGLQPQQLHNGGNDAYYTLAVMLSQIGVRFREAGLHQNDGVATPDTTRAVNITSSDTHGNQSRKRRRRRGRKR